MSARRREELRAATLRELGAPDLATYLQTAHAAGLSFDQLRSAIGIGRDRLRRELAEAGVVTRPPGHNSVDGKRSRSLTYDRVAAQRVGATDLIGWLAERRAEGWTVTALATAVGHSQPWVRTRLNRTTVEQ